MFRKNSHTGTAVKLYADFNATTPLVPEAFSSMEPFLRVEYGNASSTAHQLGKVARAAVEHARKEVADFISCDEEDIVFVSGGTESCAHSIIGLVKALRLERDQADCRIIYTAVEHPAVEQAVLFLEELGIAEGRIVPVDRDGNVNVSDFDKLLDSAVPTVVSCMMANNEVGCIYPIGEIAKLAKSRGALVHCDAVQATGKINYIFSDLGVDVLSMSAHKFGGPKGVGALVLNKGVNWHPVVKGGGQESGKRGGTEAVAQIVGMGAAASVRRGLLKSGVLVELENLRDYFENELVQLGEVSVNGSGALRLVNTSSLCFSGINAQQLMLRLAQRGIIVAAGSACHASSHTPSTVLNAMGLSDIESLGTLRVSLGFETTKEQVDFLLTALKEEVDAQHQENARAVESALEES